MDLLRAYTYSDADADANTGNEGDAEEGMCSLLGVVDWGESASGDDVTEEERDEKREDAVGEKGGAVEDQQQQQQQQQVERVSSERNPEVENGKRTGKSWRKPALEECLNLDDFESVARRVMSEATWAYYSSGADDEVVSITQYLPNPILLEL